MMFESIKILISNLAEGQRSRDRSGSDECQLATAALLTRAATVYSDMSQGRRAKLHAVLKSHFGLDDPAAAALIENSAAVDRDAVDLFHYTRHLNEALNDEGRRQIVRMMWEIAYADGRVNEFDDNIIWRAADLLGVSSRQRIELRRRIAADRVGMASAICGADFV